jgi:hypothetical protein
MNFWRSGQIWAKKIGTLMLSGQKHPKFGPVCPDINGSLPSGFLRTPENQPKCIIPGPGKILRSEGYVCANPGKFGVIFEEMYMSNPGISRGSMKVYVIIRGEI